jgi:glycosyltransferase involved in cell wall biosynthesis
MKVLHVVTRLNTGGPAVFLDHLTNAMSNMDCQSSIVYGFCEDNESDYADNHKFSGELIKIKSLHRSLNLIDDLKAFFQIRKAIIKIKPDLVNTHTSKGGVLGRLAAKSVNRKLPVVHTFHGHLIYGYFAIYKSLIFSFIEKFMSKFTDSAIAVTSETKKSITNLGIGKKLHWRVIPIGIPTTNDPVQQLSDNASLKILWVGRFTNIKDPFYAIDVIENIMKEGMSNIELKMVGDGELFEEVKNAANELPITFTGLMRNPFENIKDFDLLMLSSKNEGLPLVILEAANHGRATISRNVGGVGEFIKENQTGYLISGEPSQMAKKLIDISKDKKVLQVIGISANKLLRNDFSVEKMSSNYLSLYNELIIRS